MYVQYNGIIRQGSPYDIRAGHLIAKRLSMQCQRGGCGQTQYPKDRLESTLLDDDYLNTFPPVSHAWLMNASEAQSHKHDRQHHQGPATRTNQIWLEAHQTRIIVVQYSKSLLRDHQEQVSVAFRIY